MSSNDAFERYVWRLMYNLSCQLTDLVLSANNKNTMPVDRQTEYESTIIIPRVEGILRTVENAVRYTKHQGEQQ